MGLNPLSSLTINGQTGHPGRAGPGHPLARSSARHSLIRLVGHDGLAQRHESLLCSFLEKIYLPPSFLSAVSYMARVSLFCIPHLLRPPYMAGIILFWLPHLLSSLIFGLICAGLAHRAEAEAQTWPNGRAMPACARHQLSWAIGPWAFWPTIPTHKSSHKIQFMGYFP